MPVSLCSSRYNNDVPAPYIVRLWDRSFLFPPVHSHIRHSYSIATFCSPYFCSLQCKTVFIVTTVPPLSPVAQTVASTIPASAPGCSQELRTIRPKRQPPVIHHKLVQRGAETPAGAKTEAHYFTTLHFITLVESMEVSRTK